MTTKTEVTPEEAMYALGVLVFIFPVHISLALMRAATIYVVWGWYMPSIGVDAISLGQAFGLSVLVGLFTRAVAGKSKEPNTNEHNFKSMGHRLINMAIWCALCMVTCWCALQLWGL